MISEAEAVVIGAGAFGVSAAFHLVQCGMKRVALLDRFAPGSQSSPRAAGLFKGIQGDKTRTRLAALSINKMLNFESETGLPSPATRSGSLMVARTPQHAEYVQREAHQAQTWGAEVELLDGATIRQLMPIMKVNDILAVCHTPSDIYIEEPVTLVNAYLEAGQQRGVTVLPHTAVTGIMLKDGAVQGVTTDRGIVHSSVVIDAAGGWARAVGEQAGANVPIVPMRHQLYITNAINGVEANYPIVRFIDSAVYIRPARGGLMLGGFESNPLPVDPRQQPAHFSIDDVPLEIGVLHNLTAAVTRNVPILQETSINEHRAGLFTMTSDGRFLVGPVPEVRGFWVITGCNGSGFSFSPALGQLLAEWIVDGAPSIDLSDLAPQRFARTILDEDALHSACIWQYGHYYDPAH